MSKQQEISPPKDRPFNPSRLPATDAARVLVAEVLAALMAVERRQRKRKAADQAIHEAAVAALVCDLVHRHLTTPGAWLTIGLGKDVLSLAKRRAPFMTEKLRDLLALLAGKAKLIDFRLGERRAFGSQRSTMRAGRRLVARIEALELGYADFSRDPALLGDPIVLRGEKVPRLVGSKWRKEASDLPLPATDQVERMRRQMQQINDRLARANLEWLGDETKDKVDLGERFLKRIFNNGCLSSGGRLYGGFWQSLRRADRLTHLLIDDEPVVALDFAQSAMRQAYALVDSALPPGDLYDVPGLSGYRAESKTILNALLSADSPPTRFPRGTRGRLPKHWKFDRVYSCIARHHVPLVPLFGTGRGLQFMYQESEVLILVLEWLHDAGVTALPVHDCVLVARPEAHKAKPLMERAFNDITGIKGEVEMEGIDQRVELSIPLDNIGETSGLPICRGRKAA